MLKVIGAGFGRTGTHSLAACLETLGIGPCYTILDVDKNRDHIDFWEFAIEGEQVDWRAVYQGYRSAVEWPTVAFFPLIFEFFSQAKVILTLRDPESWYESASMTIFPGLEATAHHPDPKKRVRSRIKRQIILEKTFAGKYWDKEHTLEVYQSHIDSVIELVPPDQLLQYRITDGWEPLCGFLGVPEPDQPFPWRNERSEFLDSAPKWAKKIMGSGEDCDKPRGK